MLENPSKLVVTRKLLRQLRCRQTQTVSTPGSCSMARKLPYLLPLVRLLVATPLTGLMLMSRGSRRLLLVPPQSANCFLQTSMSLLTPTTSRSITPALVPLLMVSFGALLPVSGGTSQRFISISRRQPRLRLRTTWPLVTRSEEHTSELQSQSNLVCPLLP